MNVNKSSHRAPRRLLQPGWWIALALLVSLLLMLGGCGQIPLSSLWALRKFDFERFDPAQLRVAVALPPGLQFPSEALVLDVQLTRGASGEVLHERWPMRPSQHLPAGERWPEGMPPGQQRVLLQLDGPVQARIAMLRERAAAWKVADGDRHKKNQLQLSARPSLCQAGPASAAGPARASLWLRWSAEPGYVLLIEDKPLRELWPELPDPLPACRPV
jgi:hypothetical protein